MAGPPFFARPGTDALAGSLHYYSTHRAIARGAAALPQWQNLQFPDMQTCNLRKAEEGEKRGKPNDFCPKRPSTRPAALHFFTSS